MPTDQVKLNLEIKLFIAVDFFPLRSAVDRKAVISGLKLCGLSMALMCHQESLLTGCRDRQVR